MNPVRAGVTWLPGRVQIDYKVASVDAAQAALDVLTSDVCLKPFDKGDEVIEFCDRKNGHGGLCGPQLGELRRGNTTTQGMVR